MRGRLFSMLVLAALALTGCGPRTIISSILPMQYTVEVSQSLFENGRRTNRTVRVQCQVVDATDSIALNYETTWKGETVWFRTADGAILIEDQQRACGWSTSAPAPGETQAVPLVRPDGYPNYYGATYRFRDLNDASTIEVIPTRELVMGSGPIRLGPQTLTVVDGGATTDLLQAFPALDRIDAEVKRARAAQGGRQDAQSEAASLYMGFVATVAKLGPGIDCTGGTAVGSTLVGASCGPFAPCPANDPDGVACARDMGNVALDPAADFRTVRLASTALDASSNAITLYRAPFVQAKLNGALTWTPSVCLDDVCTPYDRSGGVVFYRPRTRIMVRVLLQSRNLDAASFVHKGYAAS